MTHFFGVRDNFFHFSLIKTLEKKSVTAKVDGQETNVMNLSVPMAVQTMLFVRSLIFVNAKKVGLGKLVRIRFVREF